MKQMYFWNRGVWISWTGTRLSPLFYRVLEYYEGILILTSNRVGTFDEAFKSRIQLALHYPNRSPAQRRRIWTNFLNRFKVMDKRALKYDALSDNIDKLAKHEMNGRQIRYVITTARQLARYRNQVLDYELLDHVIAISGKFDTYLKIVKEGLTGDDTARSMTHR
ncbi:MAG: hypothetical protein M1820_009986 [Bogoriella megaspora]|nr:MAG: hypothetical protein M1820_009986 [Bogoriella megaspora]